ncbi:MAG: sulfurtransferase TusA family protein [Neisseriaceae bacterium]|nr:sulfurtransferase TusA family protein [Neisseriaceae bacterium]
METLDLKGLRCPLPILKAKKALAKLQTGDLLCVLTTDESAPTDFKQFSYQTGHELLECSTKESEYYQIIIKHK